MMKGITKSTLLGTLCLCVFVAHPANSKASGYAELAALIVVPFLAAVAFVAALALQAVWQYFRVSLFTALLFPLLVAAAAGGALLRFGLSVTGTAAAVHTTIGLGTTLFGMAAMISFSAYAESRARTPAP